MAKNLMSITSREHLIRRRDSKRRAPSKNRNRKRRNPRVSNLPSPNQLIGEEEAEPEVAELEEVPREVEEVPREVEEALLEVAREVEFLLEF